MRWESGLCITTCRAQGVGRVGQTLNIEQEADALKMLLCGKLGDECSDCFRADQRRNCQWKEWHSHRICVGNLRSNCFPRICFLHIHTSEKIVVYLQTALVCITSSTV